MVYKVEFFVDDKNRVPVKEFLLKQSKEAKARLLVVMDNHMIPKGKLVAGKIGHPIEEFFQYRFCDCRVLTYNPTDNKNIIVLLHAFKKNVDDTPLGEIKKARTNMIKDIEIRKKEVEKTKKQSRKGQE